MIAIFHLNTNVSQYSLEVWKKWKKTVDGSLTNLYAGISKRRSSFSKRKRRILTRKSSFSKRESGILNRKRRFSKRERRILNWKKGILNRKSGFSKRERRILNQKQRILIRKSGLQFCFNFQNDAATSWQRQNETAKINLKKTKFQNNQINYSFKNVKLWQKEESQPSRLCLSFTS
jgi:hypothetical protein